jgi:signal transduction histidine kinase
VGRLRLVPARGRLDVAGPPFPDEPVRESRDATHLQRARSPIDAVAARRRNGDARERPDRFRRVVAAAAPALALALLVVAALLERDPEPLLFAPLAVSCAAVGALLWYRRAGTTMAVLFLFTGLAVAASELMSAYVDAAPRLDLPGAPWAAVAFQSSLALSTTFFVIIQLFPTGSTLGPRWRWLLWVTIAVAAAQFAVAAFGVTPEFRANFPRIAHPLDVLPRGAVDALNGIAGLGLLAVFGLAALEMVLRYRRSTGEERLQLKWFAAAAGLAAVGFGLGFVVTSNPVVFFALLSPLVPIAAGVAILRYRLYDVDVVVKRTVVAGALVAFGTVVYLAIVLGIGAAVGDRANGVLTLAAAVVVAVSFQPLRVRARRWADRLVYGDRASPYEVLSTFGERAGSSYSVDEVVPQMAEILASGTGAAFAGVWVRVGTEFRLEGAWPQDAHSSDHPAVPAEAVDRLPGVDTAVPVLHRGEVLGALGVAMPPEEPLTPAHERLIADLASQAGLVLRNVGLVEELRASRQRLVKAQDEERRRLERNLHDGAQQQLVALGVQLGLARRVAEKDAPAVAEMLERLQQQSGEALDDLRDLARGIYPPLLADRGLVAALEAQARRSVVPAEVRAEGVGRYGQEVEAAVYFCILEALQNVAKYAGASSVVVRLAEDDGILSFEVADDGAGFDASSLTYGTGLQGMADRLAVLDGTLFVQSEPGGGTTVTGRVRMRAGVSRTRASSRT